jgi:hypothetical protein
LAAVGGGVVGLVVCGFIGVSIGRAIDGPHAQIGGLDFSVPSAGAYVVVSICALVGTIGGAILGARLGASNSNNQALDR